MAKVCGDNSPRHINQAYPPSTGNVPGPLFSPMLKYPQ